MINTSTSCQVKFLPVGRTVEIDSGTTLIRAARKAGLHINASCGGAGVCGKCRVLLKEGNVDGGISDKLSPQDLNDGFRQACTSIITENIN